MSTKPNCNRISVQIKSKDYEYDDKNFPAVKNNPNFILMPVSLQDMVEIKPFIYHDIIKNMVQINYPACYETYYHGFPIREKEKRKYK